MKLHVGIDISCEEVSIAAVDRDGSNNIIRALGVFRREHEREIKQALNNSYIQSSHISLGLRDANIKVLRLDLPQVPDAERDQVAQWALQNELKVALDDFVFDYYLVDINHDYGENNKDPYVFVISEQKILKKILAYGKKLGVKNPRIVEPNICAVALNLEKNYDLLDSQYFGVINIDYNSAQLLVINQSGLLFCYDLSGLSICSIMSRLTSQNNISYEDTVSFVDSLKENSHDGLTNITTSLCIKIQEALDAFYLSYPDRPITNFLLDSSIGQVNNISEALESTFNIPTQYLDPFLKLDCSNISGQKFRNINSFSVAAGLAL